MTGVTIVTRAKLSVRKFGRGGRAFAPDFRSASCPRHRGFDPAPPHFVVKVRRGGRGIAGLSTESSVDHRGFPPKFRSITAISAETSARRDRNFGSRAQLLRRGGRRESAHAAGMGPRPIGVRLSVCVRVSYPTAAPIGIEMVKRRTHERLQVQTGCRLAG